MKVTVYVLEEKKLIYRKERTVSQTHPFGNFMGAAVKLSLDGKQTLCRFIPEPDYMGGTYVVFKKEGSQITQASSPDYYDVLAEYFDM